MSSKRRRRRRGGGGAQAGGAAEAPSEATRVHLVEWHWRTFPVFFALTAGLFAGAYIGFISQAAGNDVAQFAFIGLALPFGFALSRIFTRYVLMGRFIKPRPRR